MKTEKPQEGKFRLIYNLEEDHYNISEATGTAHTPSTNEVLYRDSKHLCMVEVVELGLTIEAEEID